MILTLREYIAAATIGLCIVFVANIHAARTNTIDGMSYPAVTFETAEESSPIVGDSIPLVEMISVPVTAAAAIDVQAAQIVLLAEQSPVELQIKIAEILLTAIDMMPEMSARRMIDFADYYYALVEESGDFVPHINSHFGFQYRELRRRTLSRGSDWYDEELHAAWTEYWKGVNCALDRQQKAQGIRSGITQGYR